jgi:hypothetical protein
LRGKLKKDWVGDASAGVGTSVGLVGWFLAGGDRKLCEEKADRSENKEVRGRNSTEKDLCAKRKMMIFMMATVQGDTN